MGKLAAVTCENSKPNKTRDRLLGDGDGLYLRIRPNGTKTWIVEYEFKGERRKFTVGLYVRTGAPAASIGEWLRHGRLSLTQARAIAGEWKAARRAGHDPVGEWEGLLASERADLAAREAAIAAEADQPTVRQAVDQFMAKHMEGKKSAAAIRYRLDRLAAILGDRKMRDVTRQMLIGALEQVAKGQRDGKSAKQLAGEVLTQAKRLWRFAEAREWVAVSCIEALTRRDIDARPVKRDVALRLDEVAEIWKALDDPARCKGDAVTVAALKMLILTGQREREVTDAEWTEFDFGAGVWKIPAARTKKNRAHLVHLAPEAIAILEHLKPITGKKRHVFASPLRANQAVFGRSVNNALITLFDRKALPNITRCHVHDLRRTLITRLPDLGFEPFIAHKIANHALPGVLAHYNHNEYLPQREAALKAWARLVVETAKPNSNVTPLKRKAVG
jgi:integrase